MSFLNETGRGYNTSKEWCWSFDKMEKVKQFCLTTSIKGIPRAVKSKTTAIRVLWLLCVIGFLTAAFVQTAALTSEFLSHGISTSLVESKVDLVGLTDHTVELPDVTLCNTNPFAGNGGVYNLKTNACRLVRAFNGEWIYLFYVILFIYLFLFVFLFVFLGGLGGDGCACVYGGCGGGGGVFVCVCVGGGGGGGGGIHIDYTEIWREGHGTVLSRFLIKVNRRVSAILLCSNLSHHTLVQHSSC